MNTKIENKCLESFTEIWQSNFISLESNKKLQLVFYFISLVTHFYCVLLKYWYTTDLKNFLDGDSLILNVSNSHYNSPVAPSLKLLSGFRGNSKGLSPDFRENLIYQLDDDPF